MFNRLLARGIKRGRITLIDWRGRVQTFGRGEPKVTVRLADGATDRALSFNPWLKVGEAYMDGKLVIEQGSLYDLIDIGMANVGGIQKARWQGLVTGFNTLARWWHQNNPVGLARQHVAHHYDMSRRLFELFLDESMQYSCGYFWKPGISLAEAQAAKMRHIASKLLLEPGQRVLDIGCGWGGLAIYLAQQCGVEVVGITLSKEQHELATQRAKDAGVDKQVKFKLQDYRLETGSYDRFVSVGMFEHVGVKHYREYFATVERVLKPKGVGLLHAIGRRDGPGFTNPWLRKYIFPGGYSPALSEVVPVVEKTSLWIADIEVLRLHYADTLRCWRQNFNRHRAEIARIYDERFCRMWEFYLIGSELSFRHSYNMVWQMQIARDVNAAPLTRDYMVDWERRMAIPARGSRDRAAE
ncbi:MAG TPA: cyclopropane-fatty-acyl-phospholipid synthase family protein [Dongiaceae bacterium]|nr:cyclopropane-fatty-acyl-phospholipid synthase family protein [Dongiaceae bacterium]